MRVVGTALVLLAAACGSLTETGDGVAFLEVLQPTTTSLEVGETLQLHARALDARGEPVDAAIRWFATSDYLHIEETSGLVTALAEGTDGRVQAQTGSGSQMIVSEPLTLSVNAPPPESSALAVPPSTPR